jgi:hypothetical protein
MASFESIDQLRLPPEVDVRLRELTRRGEANLDEHEKQELKLLLEIDQCMSSVRAKAHELAKGSSQHGGVGREVRNGLPVIVVPPGTPKIDVEAVRRFLQEEGF